MNLDLEHIENILVEWLKGKVKEAGSKGAVVGLSGGIDSAVTSVLCKKAFGDRVLGVILPCYSNKEDEEDAKLVAEKFKIKYIQKDLGPVYDKLLLTLDARGDTENNNMSVANIKPRLRMVSLYYYAARNNYLVIGTDNWSELKTGYFTKFGDGGVDLAPLGRLVKTEVRELAEYLGIPHKIISKKPSAGLWSGQTDEKEMGIKYEELDRYILKGEGKPEVKDTVEKLAKKNAHKLNSIPVPSREELILSL